MMKHDEKRLKLKDLEQKHVLQAMRLERGSVSVKELLLSPQARFTNKETDSVGRQASQNRFLYWPCTRNDPRSRPFLGFSPQF